MPFLLHDRCALERTSPGVHERVTDRLWWGHEAQFGGYVEALALAAMRAELDAPDMTAVTMGVQFFRPFGDGAFRAEVAVERRGRTMANVHARLYSQDRLAGQAVASFGLRRAVAEFRAAEPPAAVGAEPIGPGEAATPSQLGVPTHAHFDFFPRIGQLVPGSGGAEVGGWARPRFEGPVDELLLAVLQDLWLPAAYHRWREQAVAVSVDITTQFRALLPAEGVRHQDGIFVLLRTVGSLGGFVDEDCELWSADGALLAQGRQLRYVHG